MPKLTAELIESFAGIYLSPRYDSAQPTPDFHREAWEMYCTDYRQCAVAAPRNHAKSTGLTHDFILANVCFRQEDYVILVGSSEEMAIEHLGDIANELRENDELRRDFNVQRFVTDQKSDIIIQCSDGHQFRIIARGSEQKIRGRKWHGTRPGLIVFDDIEDDEQVESRDRRRKFRRWFFRACKQALRDQGRIRGHGTILHEDSLLARLMKDKTWHTKLYKAHESFSDFSNILWVEKFPEIRLRQIRQEFIEQGDAPGYSQEYLNDPFDNEDAYLRRVDFLPMGPDDYDKDKIFHVGVDFAISRLDHANRTSITVGGKDADNLVHIVDQLKGRWGTGRIIDELFATQDAWNPDLVFVEDGQIWKTLAPTIYKEMQLRDRWINFVPITPSKDKAVRGRPFQRRHRARGMRYDKTADWYEEYEAELTRFTGLGEAVLDDQFDSTALLMLGFDTLPEVEKDDFMTEEEAEFEFQAAYSRDQGRSTQTGY